MKLLLISANTEQINMPVLPLGMACVAAAVEASGHHVDTLNLMTRKNTRGRIAEAVHRGAPDLIGISVRNIDDQIMETPMFLLDSVKRVVRECRELTDRPIVLGGAGYSIFPDAALAYLGADMGIRGEGERSMVDLLDRLSRKAPLTDVPGLHLPDRGCQTVPSSKRSLDDLPPPRPGVHLDLPAGFPEESIWLPFQTRRGCPMACSYCSTPAIEGRLPRRRGVQKAVENLSRFTEAGFTRFFFVDNTFNLPSSYAEALCDGIIQKGLEIEWRAIIYPGRLKEGLVEKMAGAGCVEVALGFESGDPKILGGLNKRFGPEEIRRASGLFSAHGIGRMGFLLLGAPGETRETVLRSLQFADDLGLDAVKVTRGIRIYPGTPLAGIAQAEGILRPDEDLLFPRFYMAPGIAAWLADVTAEWMAERPNWMS